MLPSADRRARGRARRRLAVALLGILGASCATMSPPPPEVVDRARRTLTYSARLRVTVRGRDLRGRSRALLGFRRPDALRVEIPGPAGPRVIAVAREGGLTAVFPGDRAVFHGAASAAALDALFGVPLTPPEVMDLLVGAAPPRLRSHDVRWGPELPRDVRATLEDGTRLSVEIEDAEGGPPLPEAAFEAPPSEGYRVVDASEARDLLAER